MEKQFADLFLLGGFSGNRLKELRARYRVTQFVLGLKSGVCQTRISYYERGLIKPRVDEKKKLAEALGLTIGDVFPDDPNDTNTK